MTPFVSRNPATEEVWAEYPLMSEDEVAQALQLASEGFSWNCRASFARRAEYMARLAELLDDKAEQWADLMAREMGKPLMQGIAEARKCARMTRYFAEHAEAFLAPILKETEAEKTYIAFQPLGTILLVMPWNFPFWQVLRCAVPAIMAGNVVLLKHAPNVPTCAHTLEQLFREAGFPEGVFQNLFVDEATVARIIADRRVHGVALTGSVRAGSAVASVAGKAIKKSVLELGGSDPFVVLEDADLDKAVRTAVLARIQNNGQSCIASKRFILMEPIAEAFTEQFVARLKALKMGDPRQRDTDIGPMARADLREQLHRQVTDSIAAGARLLLGGTLPERPGYFYPPTVLADVRPGMPAYDEETFGPVAALITARTEEEALELANHPRYGLGATVFTQDLKRGEQWALALESGMVFVNDLVRSDPRVPFGGIKESGYGRELSEFGIREFTNVKTIWIAHP